MMYWQWMDDRVSGSLGLSDASSMPWPVKMSRMELRFLCQKADATYLVSESGQHGQPCKLHFVSSHLILMQSATTEKC